MKRITATALAILMVLNLCVSAFALTLSPVADKNSVAPGEDVTVTLSLDEAISDVTALEAKLYFDQDKFTFKSGTSEVSGVTVNKTVQTEEDSGKPYILVNYIEMTGRGSVPAGSYATVTFTASEAIKDVSKAAFSALIASSLMVDGSSSANTKEVSLSVTVTPASTEVKGYAVAAVAKNPSITVKEDAQVALKISNKDVETYNAYYMEVSYDAAKLTYKSVTSTDAEVIDNNGTLKIVGYGADKTCGTDNIVLTFTGKATGEAKVTVTSAKVDVKGNADAKDAPAATLLTKEATITVGGYQVTLPDDFKGEGTANPGQNYTFAARDTSKKYDFTGSTMGDETVEVIDNNDGTYTVENVTGPLVITATEKVGKVTINLSGDAVDTIVNKSWDPATEVDEGTELSFTAELEPGKELEVTVNGTEVTGSSRPGAMFYTITADQVTGPELNIVVNYKVAGKATIIETGSAWKKVGSSLRRVGWTKSGDKVDAGTALDFFFIPESGKAIEDYVIRANSVDCTYTKVGGRYKVTIPATIITAGATVTINFDYTATPEPAITVDVSEYLKLDNQSIFLITAACDELTKDKVLAYNEKPMYWSSKYGESGAYAWLVIADGTKSLDALKAEAKTVIAAVDGTKAEIVYDGDVNQTKSVDINDAQLVWNMYNAEYKTDTDFRMVNRLKYLSADMNGDRAVNVLDATVIVDNITK